MTGIVLHHHTGLGDHFICNGLVNELSKKYKIYLICKTSYYTTVNCLYTDNFNVKPILISGETFEDEIKQVEIICNNLNLPLLRIGFVNLDHNKFDRVFYESLNIDFGFRYSSFTLPKINLGSSILYKNLAKETPYILVHKQSSDNKEFNIQIDSTSNIIMVDPYITDNMLDWIELIENAKEIHCVPSSFYCLVDSLNNLRGKLFYHNIRKGTLIHPNNEYNNNKWNIIDYAEKL